MSGPDLSQLRPSRVLTDAGTCIEQAFAIIRKVEAQVVALQGIDTPEKRHQARVELQQAMRAMVGLRIAMKNMSDAMRQLEQAGRVPGVEAQPERKLIT